MDERSPTLATRIALARMLHPYEYWSLPIAEDRRVHSLIPESPDGNLPAAPEPFWIGIRGVVKHMHCLAIQCIKAASKNAIAPDG
ncbi:hypothetical protein [Paraburkholderia sp. BCC1884]|uniref:hypothetical protein n=1 Tax=Paraburkholderia sp. BCC1884 TaxID=2562668 RepID=UPI0011834054|nr:hypothetical protein [Paraburkholderia sp. BCC1884]